MDQNKPGSLIDGTEDREFPAHLIESNKDFQAALANCNFRDEEERNLAVIYYNTCKLFGLTDEMQAIIDKLNGSISIGGYSRVLAASSHIGMLHPSALGVKLNKEGEKAWAAAAWDTKRTRDENHGRDGDGRAE